MDSENLAAKKESAQMRRRIKRFLINKKWERAIDACSDALELDPGCYKVLRLRALAHTALQEHSAALRDSEAVLAKVPGSGDAWYQMGYSHYHLKQFVQAARCFSQGLALNPSDRMLQQGYWDSLGLMCQTRTDPTMAAVLPPLHGDAAVGGLPIMDYSAPELSAM